MWPDVKQYELRHLLNSTLTTVTKTTLPTCSTLHIYNYAHLEDLLSILLYVYVSIVMSTSFNKHSQERLGNSCFITHSWCHTSSWRTRPIYTVNSGQWSKTTYSAKNTKSLSHRLNRHVDCRAIRAIQSHVQKCKKQLCTYTHNAFTTTATKYIDRSILCFVQLTQLFFICSMFCWIP